MIADASPARRSGHWTKLERDKMSGMVRWDRLGACRDEIRALYPAGGHFAHVVAMAARSASGLADSRAGVLSVGGTSLRLRPLAGHLSNA